MTARTAWDAIQSNLRYLSLEDLAELRDDVDERINNYDLPDDDEGF